MADEKKLSLRIPRDEITDEQFQSIVQASATSRFPIYQEKDSQAVIIKPLASTEFGQLVTAIDQHWGIPFNGVKVSEAKDE